MKHVTLTVNGNSVRVPDGSTVLQACEQAGVTVPRFCYHAHLSIAGNCRRCLVEVEKSPKLQVSCALPVRQGRVVHTETAAVRKAREAVREFLLVNHPLDCPICDQGGECDLQDQARAFGPDRSRFQEYKRAVQDKRRGPLVKTIRTRCIQCTRCVRFASEVAGVQELGTIGRGNNLEISRSAFDVGLPASGRPTKIDHAGISVYEKQRFAARGRTLIDPDVVGNVGHHNVDSTGVINKDLIPQPIAPQTQTGVEELLETFASSGARNSNLTGNLIDVCPVGALTSFPYAFTARPWELTKIETYDVLTPERSPIRVDTRGVGPSSILRVLPRTEYNTQLPWIGDKTRFAYDSRTRQRISTPRVPVNEHLAPCTWEKAFLVHRALYFTWGSCIERRLGTTVSMETVNCAKLFKAYYENLYRTQVNIRVEPQVTGAFHKGADSYKFGTLGHTLAHDLSRGNDLEEARYWGSRNTIKNELLTTKRGDLEEADLVLRVGRDPRKEVPVRNVRLRNKLLQKGGPLSGKPFTVARIGGTPDFSYPVQHLGVGVRTLREIIEGRHPFCKDLLNAQKPLILVGQSVRERSDSETLWKLRAKRGTRCAGDEAANGYGTHWRPTCVGQASAAYLGVGDALTARYEIPWRTVHYRDGTFNTFLEEEPYGLWCIDAQIPLNWNEDYNWVVYQGAHGDPVVGSAGVVRPSASITEQGGTYIDYEGKRKQTRPLYVTDGTARFSWDILWARLNLTGNGFSAATPQNITTSLEAQSADLALRYGYVCENSPIASVKSLPLPSSVHGKRYPWEGTGVVVFSPIASSIENYFRADRYSSFSPTRAKCTLASADLEKRTAFTPALTH